MTPNTTHHQPPPPWTPEERARVLLHRIGLLRHCVHLPNTTAGERTDWLREMERAWAELRGLYPVEAGLPGGGAAVTNGEAAADVPKRGDAGGARGCAGGWPPACRSAGFQEELGQLFKIDWLAAQQVGAEVAGGVEQGGVGGGGHDHEPGVRR
jgi:hypothetical protein